MLAQEITRQKRDGQALPREHIESFVQGLVDGSWSETQSAAMTMALFIQGMNPTEAVDLTRAMTHSGAVMDWASANLSGPILDKHSTGGVGDKVSLMLAPIVAACGGFVPMISGRGLGHTGGTLDKLQSIPGYCATPDTALLRQALQTAGCAIIGQTAELAPADRRLYALRDETGTVESVALITASILSKKLAAGLQGLVMDVKTGNGAFAASHGMAMELAASLVKVANGAGLPTRALITDMNQVLGDTCGNAVEVHEAIAFLKGDHQEPRLLDITRQLSSELLLIGHLANDTAQALQQVDAALASGRALEHFARMVQVLGGPADLVNQPNHYLPTAPVQRVIKVTRAGWVASMDTRAIGLLIIELGGGRRRATDTVDPRVGFTQFAKIGQRVEVGDTLAVAHAADDSAAQMAQQALVSCVHMADHQPEILPTLIARL